MEASGTTAVIAVGNCKGGVGKSTTAAQLALHAGAAGIRTLLIDGDPGRSALSWATQAADWPHEQVPVIAHHSPDLPRRLPGLSQGFGAVVIDTPHDPTGGTAVGPMLAGAIACATYLVVPTPPSFADLDRLGDLLGAIEAEQQRRDLAWSLLLTRVDLRRRAAADAARAELVGRGLPVLDPWVPERAAVEDAFGTALALLEYAAPAAALLDLAAVAR